MFESDSTTTEAPVAGRSEEFEAFRTLVRQRAIMARDSMGWPSESLNKTLVTLGLEPVDAWTVRVKVTATAQYTREYGARRAAVTREEAIQRAKDMNDSQMRENIGWDAWQFVERGEPEVVNAGVDGTEPDPVALGTDLDAYKKLVRRVGISVAKERAWCDSGTSEYLQALGLAPVQRFRVPVEVTVVQRYSHEEVEAESLEEARALVAERQITVDQVRAQLGSTIRDLQSVAPLDMDTIQVGDPDPAEAYLSHCSERSPAGSGHRCTRERGHAGQHIAGNGRTVIEVWPGAVREPVTV